jgi:hypothetical protein
MGETFWRHAKELLRVLTRGSVEGACDAGHEWLSFLASGVGVTVLAPSTVLYSETVVLPVAVSVEMVGCGGRFVLGRDGLELRSAGNVTGLRTPLFRRTAVDRGAGRSKG